MQSPPVRQIEAATQVIETQLDDPHATDCSPRDKLLYPAAYLCLDLRKPSQTREHFVECIELSPGSAYARRARQFLRLDELKRTPQRINESIENPELTPRGPDENAVLSRVR